MKIARQYFVELPEPQNQRVKFIGREQSYHGNTLGSLSVSGHPPRRALYEKMLSNNTSRVSSCDPYRGKTDGETDAVYVARLAHELDEEFQRVGAETVCAFVAETVCGSVRYIESSLSARLLLTNERTDHGGRSSGAWLLQSYEGSLRSLWSSVHHG